MYEELIERLRYKAEVFNEFSQAELYREAADAIEKLEKAMDGLMDYYTATYMKLDAINSLHDSQHYSGRYIKSIMGVEHGKSNDSNL